MYESLLDCWYLSGATATGKTKVALELAKRMEVELISMDSMAVYRDMDIGTAKPSQELRDQVLHHMIDVVDPNKMFSVSDYLEMVNARVAEIRQRGREVLFVGGTPLYLKSLLRGMFEGPPADPEFRREVEEESNRVGNEELHKRLEQVDPLTASRLHVNDRRRIIRALEVYKTTGQPISHYQLQFDEGRSAEECKVFVLQRPRDVLHLRIEDRVDRMFEAGLVSEVQGLLEKYEELSRTASQAVGYREVIDHLDGQFDLDQAIERTKARTRRFARRQETWFRGLSECRFVPVDDDGEPSNIADQILAAA